MKGLGTIAVAALAVLGFFHPGIGAWLFAAGELVFLAWLGLQLRRTDGATLVAAAAEPLEPDESEIVQRYAFYFAQPSRARECASMLAALGLASLLLVPWLTYKTQWIPAIVIGALLFRVARLTRLLSPGYSLRLAASKGDREALRLLSAHDRASRKIARGTV